MKALHVLMSFAPAIIACTDGASSSAPEATAGDTAVIETVPETVPETVAETVAETSEPETVAETSEPETVAETSETETEVTPASTIVSADFGASDGPVRNLFGVNKLPRFGDARGGGHNYDVTQLWKQLGVSQARLHDVVDLCTIYKDALIEEMSSGTPVAVTICGAVTGSGPPHLRWTPRDLAKVDDPANYDFAQLDTDIALILGTGADLYLRLGHNYNGANDTSDAEAWAKVATNIYKHLIGEFAPSALEADPTHVEVFNEPDGMFWVGDREVFFDLFRRTVDGVRAAATAAGKSPIVGGPGFTNNYLSKATKPTSAANGFVAAVTTGRLDFFSVHRYDTCATATLAASQGFFAAVRAEVDRQGASEIPLHLTEWNIGLGQSCGETFYAEPRVQSFISGMLTLMQAEAYDIEAAHYYSGSVPMGLFSVDASVVGTVTVRPHAWALWAHSRLKSGTKAVTQVCAAGTCGSGLSSDGPLVALAATGANGTRYVIVTNDSDAPVAYTLRVAGAGTPNTVGRYAPPTGTVTVAAALSGGSYVVSEAAVQALVGAIARQTTATRVVGGGIEVDVTVGARTFQLLEL